VTGYITHPYNHIITSAQHSTTERDMTLIWYLVVRFSPSLEVGGVRSQGKTGAGEGDDETWNKGRGNEGEGQGRERSLGNGKGKKERS
jgi:hypothetical protein